MHYNLMLGLTIFWSLVPSVVGDDCIPADEDPTLAVGDIDCMYWKRTYPDINHVSCVKLADKYKITVEDLLYLNPGLDKQCSNIAANTEYCIFGHIVRPIAIDGKCGIPHDEATCSGTAKGCCNSETWTCGDTLADCAPGTCYEGDCTGARYWSIDGKCGRQHNYIKCAGKWGDCCNNDGRCGTGPAFCAPDNCQSGDCTRITHSLDDFPWAMGNTTDGTCGGPSAMTCNILWGNCCGKDGKCSSNASACDLQQGCQSGFGKCSKPRGAAKMNGKKYQEMTPYERMVWADTVDLDDLDFEEFRVTEYILHVNETVETIDHGANAQH